MPKDTTIICLGHLNMVLAMVGHIMLDRISKKTALLFNDIDQVIHAQAFTAITTFAINQRINMTKTITFIILNFIAINSYAYLNIPMPQSGMDAFSKGLDSGSRFGNNIIAAQQAQESIRMQRQEEAMRQLQMEIMREQLRQLKKIGNKAKQ